MGALLATIMRWIVYATALASTPVPQPSPTAEPTIAPVVRAPDPAVIAEKVCAYDWDCDTALRVFTCESHLGNDPRTYDLSRLSGGIAQIYRPTWEQFMLVNHGWTWEQIVLDDGINLAAAWVIYLRAGGWTPWDCY